MSRIAHVSCAFLADHPEAVISVAGWLIDEWWPEKTKQAAEELVSALQQRASRDRVPIDLVALIGDQVVGVATIKPHELREQFPDFANWLGGVLVDPKQRGQGVAAALAEHAAVVARSLGISVLHLQTDRLDGGLYRELGWEPWKQVEHEGSQRLVMRRPL
jgi:GNAT superfamily N-acetyltransferase